MGYLLSMQRVRAMSCMIVCIQHIIAILHLRIADYVPTLLGRGIGGGRLFFVISGYFLTNTLNKLFQNTQLDLNNTTLYQRLTGDNFQKLYQMLVKKWFRIMPVALTVLMCAIIIAYSFSYIWQEDFHVSISVATITRCLSDMLFFLYNYDAMDFRSEGDWTWASSLLPLWWLSVLGQLTVIWSVLYIICKNDNTRFILALILCILSALVARSVIIRIDYMYYYYSTLTNADGFFAGIIVAFARFNQQNPKVNMPNSQNSSVNYTTALMSLFFILMIWIYPSVSRERYLDSWLIGFDNMVVLLSSTALVWMASGDQNGRRGSVLYIPGLNTVLEWFGERSFSFYAIHSLVFITAIFLLNTYIFAQSDYEKLTIAFIELIVCVISALIFTEVIYQLFEKPNKSTKNIKPSISNN